MATTIVTTAQVREHLDVNDARFEGALQSLCNAVAVEIEGIIGPVDPATHTRVVEGDGDECLVLPHTQVTGITSLAYVESGAAPSVDITPGNLVIDADAGLVYLRSGVWPDEEMLVTYTVGRASVPSAVTEAAKLRVQAVWSARRGSGRPGKGGTDVAWLIGRSDALLAPYRTALGFA